MTVELTFEKFLQWFFYEISTVNLNKKMNCRANIWQILPEDMADTCPGAGLFSEFVGSEFVGLEFVEFCSGME